MLEAGFISLVLIQHVQTGELTTESTAWTHSAVNPYVTWQSTCVQMRRGSFSLRLQVCLSPGVLQRLDPLESGGGAEAGGTTNPAQNAHTRCSVRGPARSTTLLTHSVGLQDVKTRLLQSVSTDAAAQSNFSSVSGATESGESSGTYRRKAAGSRSAAHFLVSCEWSWEQTGSISLWFLFVLLSPP